MKFIFLIIFFAISAIAQQAFVDTLCFTIALSPDSNSLLGCGKNDDMRTVLAGPIIMEKNNLLFSSCNGYALYNQSGELLDSHSVFKDNKKISFTDPQRMIFAYPLDGKTVLYYRRNHKNGDSLEIFEKKISKRGLLRIENASFPNLKEIETSRLFNLAQNGFTDELSPKSFLKTNLIGYTSLTSGKN